ncbi:hypothetical protein V8C86DRAFT_2622044 [Haematococcus lacustris]
MDDIMRLLVPAEKAEKAAHGARDMVSPTGISLAYLFRLGEALPPHTRAMSTYQVAQELMHLTQASQCRLLDRCPAQCRALPKYFIIHCWQAHFHHTMVQLRRYAHEHGLDTSTTIVWMDLVCANLHCPSLGARDPAVLKEVLRTCKQVVLVLDALATPFTRTWCCYELWVAMRLPPKSKFLQCEDRLHIVAYEPNWLHFAGLLVGLRLDGTKASRVPDQQRLLQELKEDPELVPKQEQVGTVLLAGLLAASAAQLEVAERSRQAYPRRYTSASTQRALMLAAGGHMWEAEKAVRALLQEHQEQRALLPPQEHAALTTGLASLIALGGYPEEAHRLVCEALRHQQAAGSAPGAEAGSRSESLQAAQLVCSTEVLAHALHCLSQHTEAERVAKRVLASATPGAAPGAGGPLAETETEPGKGQSGAAPSRGYILSLRHMAAIKARASQMDRALQYQRHALFLAEKHLPMQHMDLGAIRSELAQLLHSTGQHAVALEVVNKALAVAAQLQGQLAGDLVPLQVLRTHCLIALGQLADAHAQAVALYHAAHSARLGCATSTSAHHGRFKHEDQLHTSAIRVSEKAVEAVRDAWVRSGRALLQRDPGAELEAASRLTSGLLLQLKLQAHAPCVDNQQLCEELEEETARVLSRLGKQLDIRALMKQEANERHA